MRISLYARHHITIPWKLRILKPKNSRVSIYPWSLKFSLKSRLLFNLFYCFCMFVKKIFQISWVCISQKVNSVIVQNFRHIYFYVKTKILIDFHICISVPLSLLCKYKLYFYNFCSTSKKLWSYVKIFLAD